MALEVQERHSNRLVSIVKRSRWTSITAVTAYKEISNHGGLFETARKLKVDYILAEEFATDTE